MLPEGEELVVSPPDLNGVHRQGNRTQVELVALPAPEEVDKAEPLLYRAFYEPGSQH